MIEIQLSPTMGKVATRIPKDLNDLIYGECSYEIAGAEHMIRSGRYGNKWSKRQWDGMKRLYHRSRRTFPRGLLPRVLRVIREAGHQVSFQFPPPEPLEPVVYGAPNPAFDPHDYQRHAIATAIGEERCMVQLPTGGGKTVVAAHIIQQIGRRALFLVHTKDLLYQAKDSFSRILGDMFVGQIGDGIIDPKPITVCTIQTACRALEQEFVQYEYEEDERWDDLETPAEHAAQTIRGAAVAFMDECHRVAAPTAMNVMQSLDRAQFRIGLSASPWRDDGEDMALEAAFGPVAVRMSASELAERGFLVNPIIRFAQVPPMGFPKRTRYPTVYNEYVLNNEERNRIIIERTMDMHRRGRSVLVLVRLIQHGEKLEKALREKGIPALFLSGRDEASYRRRVLDDMRNGGLRCLIATTIADEGLDIKPLSGLVLAGGGKSSTRALQRVGRVLRTFPGKKNAEVVDFEDNARWLIDHSGERERIYRSEPAWSITDI